MPKFILTIIDGCRPDGLAKANTPNLDSLWQNGAYSWKAQSVMPSISLPCHTSMFRSIPPSKHGIVDNLYMPSAAQFPSILEVAAHGDLHTAFFASWEELRDLARPGSLEAGYYRHYRPGRDNDTIIMNMAIPHIINEQRLHDDLSGRRGHDRTRLRLDIAGIHRQYRGERQKRG